MKEPIFTKEAVEKILAGQEEVGQKVDALFSLYNEDLNGIKMNRDDFKKEKEALEVKVADLTAANAKGAEDFAQLQKQLEANSPDEIKKAYEQKQSELENSYKGVLAEKDTSIKSLTEQLAVAHKNEHSLKCVQDFNKATTGFDIEPSSRDFLFNAIYGQDGGNFSERDLGNGLQLINKDGQTGEGAVRAFLNTDFGKKFLKNLSSGGGAGTNGNGGGSKGPVINPFKKETWNLSEQAKLLREDPEQYKLMKAAANA